MIHRAGQVIMMALFLIFCPLSVLFEPLPRPDPASICKMLTEGGLKETITFLGWFINTRRFTIALQAENTVAGSAEIWSVTKRRKAIRHKEP